MKFSIVDKNVVEAKWLLVKSLDLGNVPIGKGTPDKYYLIEKDEQPHILLKVYYDMWGFEENIVMKQYLAIGFSRYFYLINIQNGNIISYIDFEDQYFGHIYVDEKFIWISSMQHLICMNIEGKILWRINELAVDGIIIEDYDGKYLSISCEMDPPGGWVDHTVDNQTGKIYF